MRQYLFKLLFILFVSASINGFAECNCAQDQSRFVPCGKTYVKPERINLQKNAIFVQIGDEIVQTESLSADEQGIFIMNVRKKVCHGYQQWLCTRPIDLRGMP